MIELHSWITAIVYPFVNGFAGVLFFAAFAKRRDVVALALLGTASSLSFFISLIWLGVRLQKAFSVEILSSQASRILWVVQAFAEYLSISMFLAGVIVLCRFLLLNRGCARSEDKS
jgi:hypothetical protein